MRILIKKKRCAQVVTKKWWHNGLNVVMLFMSVFPICRQAQDKWHVDMIFSALTSARSLRECWILGQRPHHLSVDPLNVHTIKTMFDPYINTGPQLLEACRNKWAAWVPLHSSGQWLQVRWVSFVLGLSANWENRHK